MNVDLLIDIFELQMPGNIEAKVTSCQLAYELGYWVDLLGLLYISIGSQYY